MVPPTHRNAWGVEPENPAIMEPSVFAAVPLLLLLYGDGRKPRRVVVEPPTQLKASVGPPAVIYPVTILPLALTLLAATLF